MSWRSRFTSDHRDSHCLLRCSHLPLFLQRSTEMFSVFTAQGHVCESHIRVSRFTFHNFHGKNIFCLSLLSFLGVCLSLLSLLGNSFLHLLSELQVHTFECQMIPHLEPSKSRCSVNKWIKLCKWILKKKNPKLLIKIKIYNKTVHFTWLCSSVSKSCSSDFSSGIPVLWWAS